MSDRETNLIRKALGGDVDAFEALVAPHQARLFRLMCATAGNAEDAEDALQETLLRAYRALRSFRGDASFATWLYRMALNTCRNWVRSEHRASSQRVAAKMAVGRAYPEPELQAEVLRREEERLVRNALLRLPAHYRDAMVLRHYQELSYEEIASVLDVPVGTVRSRIAQARKLLLRTLTNTGCFVQPRGE